MTGGHTEADTEQPARKNGRQSKSKLNKKGETPVHLLFDGRLIGDPATSQPCKHCTPRGSKKKGAVGSNLASTPSELQDMAAEVAELDTMPLDDEESEAFFSAASEFS